MRLVEYFMEPMLTVMLTAGTTGLSLPEIAPPFAPSGNGENRPGPAELEAQAASLLDAAKDRALLAGYAPDYVEAADFAVCALLDETLLSSSWPGREEWLLRPLQRIRHATATAGEDFYAILDSLLEKANAENLRMEPEENAQTANGPRAEKSERAALAAALEVFALCLSQGFTGMHFHNPAAVREKLRAIARLLPDLKEMISPDGRPLFCASQPKEAAPRRRDLFRLRFDALDWLLWLLPPLVVIALYYVYSSRLDKLVETVLAGKMSP